MLNNLLNIVFAGTSDFAAKILNSLLYSESYNKTFTISAVYTQPDRESGRGRKIVPSPVKQAVLAYLSNNPLNINNINNINIEQPVNFKDINDIQKLESYQPDLIIVVAYGLILPKAILDIPKYECVNIHASLLPRWRGAAPIQRAILAGDTQTGITIQKMEQKLDTGPIILQETCDILNNDTTISLSNKLCDIAITLVNNLVANYQNILNKNYVIQDNSLANYAHKLEKTESAINWHDSAVNIHRKIRALNPWPSVTTISLGTMFKIIDAHIYFNLLDNSPDLNSDLNSDLKILPGTILNNHKKIIVQTNNGQLEITKLQFSGGKVITAQDALNSKYRALFAAGNVLK